MANSMILYEALSEIRRWRNRGAHNKQDTKITQDEARQLVKLMTQVVQHVFKAETMSHLTKQLSNRRKSIDS